MQKLGALILAAGLVTAPVAQMPAHSTLNVLIYALTTGGSTGGPRLVAYDKATGKEVASVDLPGAAIGTPMTYLLNGKQYIAITVQGRMATDVPELVALALP